MSAVSFGRFTSFDTNARFAGVVNAQPRTGSTAMDPQLNTPKLPGYTSEPCSEGAVKRPS